MNCFTIHLKLMLTKYELFHNSFKADAYEV